MHSVLGRVFRIPVIDGNGIQKTWMDFGLSTNIDPQLFSLTWAIFYTLVIYFIVNEMYKRKIFIKI